MMISQCIDCNCQNALAYYMSGFRCPLYHSLIEIMTGESKGIYHITVHVLRRKTEMSKFQNFKITKKNLKIWPTRHFLRNCTISEQILDLLQQTPKLIILIRQFTISNDNLDIFFLDSKAPDWSAYRPIFQRRICI